jgi:hypothetical protein
MEAYFTQLPEFQSYSSAICLKSSPRVIPAMTSISINDPQHPHLPANLCTHLRDRIVALGNEDKLSALSPQERAAKNLRGN